MLQCEFISSTFTAATFLSLSLRPFKFTRWDFLLGHLLLSDAGRWRCTSYKPNAALLIKMNFVHLENSWMSMRSSAALSSTRSQLGEIQPEFSRVWLIKHSAAGSLRPASCSTDASSFFILGSFSWKATWVCFMLLCICINVWVF